MFDPDTVFSSNSKEAKQRFESYFKDDPFPDIQSALLNSADIYDYVRVTGMVWPFDPDNGKLKSASYEVDFLGTLHLVNSDSGRYEIRTINPGESYILPKNSISFLFTDTVFHLPRYMAARFNLRIKLVHAGLLLGTGPLIDPGFAGRLLIPLHNLTSEDFIIHGGEGLIWVEFTKLSPIKEPDGYYRKGRYNTFPDKNRYTCALTYLRKASRTGLAVPAASSIPEAILKAQKDADNAKSNADDARKSADKAKGEATQISQKFTTFGLAGLIAVVIALVALFLDLHYFIDNTSGGLRDQIKEIAILSKSLEDRIMQTEQAQKSLQILHEEIAALKRELDSSSTSSMGIENRIRHLEEKHQRDGINTSSMQSKKVLGR